ncbi:UNVERIFIED_CONTAM: hypothetical protein Sradi_6185300 [Sesamum radiatum]|uniref:Gag-pol polyprotein n=1 Tax=Sesamum radiatum TaxID=300843 RepID=A0AAW2KAC7_SESRA
MSRSRSRDRFKRNGQGKEEQAGENTPTKGVIHTISGGPTCGDSTRAQKRYARNFRHYQRKQVLSIEQQEDITFGGRDLSPGSGLQNDPMVIRMDIANYLVHKVLIDNGSSIDIIFMNI